MTRIFRNARLISQKPQNISHLMPTKELCIFIALITFSISNQAHADSATHCKSDEIDFFSCSIVNSKKVVSLCGNRKEETNEVSWLQYRFGVIDHPELIYPTKRDGSLTKFYSGGGQSDEGRYEQHNIWFRIGAYSYSVSTAAYGEAKTEFAASVYYEKRTSAVNGRRLLEHGDLSCSQPSKKLMDDLDDLWMVLPHREPEMEN